MNINFGKTEIPVKGQKDVYAVLTIERRDPKWEGYGYRVHLGIKKIEHLTDERTGMQYVRTHTTSELMMKSIGAKILTEIRRRSDKTDAQAVQWVKERWAQMLDQFLGMNPGIELELQEA